MYRFQGRALQELGGRGGVRLSGQKFAAVGPPEPGGGGAKPSSSWGFAGGETTPPQATESEIGLAAQAGQLGGGGSAAES